MLKPVRKFLLKLAVTPDRTRRLIARLVSWFLQWATERKAWDAVSALPKWLRLIADFIERWNETELPAAKDSLVAELVGRAVTDEAVCRLIDEVSALAVVPAGPVPGVEAR